MWARLGGGPAGSSAPGAFCEWRLGSGVYRISRKYTGQEGRERQRLGCGGNAPWKDSCRFALLLGANNKQRILSFYSAL